MSYSKEKALAELLRRGYTLREIYGDEPNEKQSTELTEAKKAYQEFKESPSEVDYTENVEGPNLLSQDKKASEKWDTNLGKFAARQVKNLIAAPGSLADLGALASNLVFRTDLPTDANQRIKRNIDTLTQGYTKTPNTTAGKYEELISDAIMGMPFFGAGGKGLQAAGKAIQTAGKASKIVKGVGKGTEKVGSFIGGGTNLRNLSDIGANVGAAVAPNFVGVEDNPAAAMVVSVLGSRFGAGRGAQAERVLQQKINPKEIPKVKTNADLFKEMDVPYTAADVTNSSLLKMGANALGNTLYGGNVQKVYKQQTKKVNDFLTGDLKETSIGDVTKNADDLFKEGLEKSIADIRAKHDKNFAKLDEYLVPLNPNAKLNNTYEYAQKLIKDHQKSPSMWKDFKKTKTYQILEDLGLTSSKLNVNGQQIDPSSPLGKQLLEKTGGTIPKINYFEGKIKAQEIRDKVGEPLYLLGNKTQGELKTLSKNLKKDLDATAEHELKALEKLKPDSEAYKHYKETNAAYAEFKKTLEDPLNKMLKASNSNGSNLFNNVMANTKKQGINIELINKGLSPEERTQARNYVNYKMGYSKQADNNFSPVIWNNNWKALSSKQKKELFNTPELLKRAENYSKIIDIQKQFFDQSNTSKSGVYTQMFKNMSELGTLSYSLIKGDFKTAAMVSAGILTQAALAKSITNKHLMNLVEKVMQSKSKKQLLNEVHKIEKAKSLPPAIRQAAKKIINTTMDASENSDD